MLLFHQVHLFICFENLEPCAFILDCLPIRDLFSSDNLFLVKKKTISQNKTFSRSKKCQRYELTTYWKCFIKWPGSIRTDFKMYYMDIIIEWVMIEILLNAFILDCVSIFKNLVKIEEVKNSKVKFDFIKTLTILWFC